MAKTARDIMSTNVISVPPEMSVEELGRLFIENNIGGAPVLDQEGRMIGIVTENDIITHEKRLHIPTVLRLFDAFIPLESNAKIEREIKKIAATRVSEISSANVITITEDTPIDEIATIMSEKNIHLLPVVTDGRVVGLVDRHDMLRGIAG